MRKMIQLQVFIILFLGFCVVLLYQHLYRIEFQKEMKVSFLSVGQGDAIFIETPNNKQMLIDGGRNKTLLAELGKVMPVTDRSIDVVIGTHPDADHLGGLPYVFESYEVGVYVEPGIEVEKDINDRISHDVVEEKSEKVVARKGMKIVLDEPNNIFFEILFPDRDVSTWETNAGSIVGRLVYNEDSFLFTGDSPLAIEEYLVSTQREKLDSDIVKAGHHGSRTSSSYVFMLATSPEEVVISAGKGNSYGHPHKEVLDILKSLKIPYVGTYDEGTITYTTRGSGVTHK